VAKVFALFIARREDGVPIYSKNLAPDRVNPDLISSLLTALRELVKEISLGGDAGLRLIEAHGFSILIEPGNLIFGALLTDKEDPLLRDCLRITVRTFEEQFKEPLEKGEPDTEVYRAFDEVCDRILSVIALSSYHVPKLGGWAEGDIRIPEELWAVMRHIDGRSTVAELAERAGLSLEEAIERVKRLAERGVVEVDVCEPVEAVARAYEDILNELTGKFTELLGRAVVARLVEDTLRDWGEPWMAHEGEGKLTARELERLAWLHTPKEVANMMNNLLGTLAGKARELLGELATDLNLTARKTLLAKYRPVLEKFEALEGEGSAG